MHLAAMWRLKALLAHDDRLELFGLTRALTDGGVEVVGEARTPQQIPPLMTRTRPDVLLVAVTLLEHDDYATLTLLRRRHPGTIVIVLRGAGDAGRTQVAMTRGASGFISTTADPVAIPVILREAVAGNFGYAPADEDAATAGLTSRELTVLRGVARGLSNDAIGRELWLSPHTVKSHLHRIYAKLGVANRTEATRFALEHNLAGETAPTA